MRAPEVGSANEEVGYEDEFHRAYLMLRFGRSWSGNERNCCFLNTAGQRFANISTVAGLDYLDDSRGLASVEVRFSISR